jgi:hypothetical protein
MKKVTLGLTLLFVLFAFTQANSAVVWDSEYYQFRFAVQPNGGIFYDGGQYFNPNGQAIQVFTNAGATCGSFGDIAQGSLSELGGTIQVNAMAKGPDGGINPETGLLVEGYAEVVLDGFQTNYGVEVNQKAQAWITRRFTVDESGDYFVSTNFMGEANFNAFGEPVLRHHALYSFKGTVILEEYEDGFSPTWLREVARFTFDNTTGSDSVSVELSNRTGIVYQIKTLLEITTDIQNLYLFGVQGPLVGPYEVGSAENPFQLSASVTSVMYDLDVTTVGSGTVTLDPAGGVYEEDTEVTLTATADAGWQFSEWSGDLTGSENPATITMDADKAVTATFVPEYTLDVTTAGSGTVNLDPAGGVYAEGTVVTVTATPDAGWDFTEWSGDLTGSANPEVITMDGDKAVTATFTEAGPQYSLTVNTAGGGTVTLDPAGGVYEEGTIVTVTAMADTGWSFSEWSGDLSGSVNPQTITMDGEKTVTATFIETGTQFALTLNTVGTGGVSLDPAGGLYDEGTVVTLTAVPGMGWEFTEWGGDLTGSANPATITMDGDKTVTATFTEVPEFDLIVNIEGAGAVALDPIGGTYPQGTVVTLTATPDMGWAFSEWSGDAAGSQNTAAVVMDDHKMVTAAFTEVLPGQFVLTVTTEGSGIVIVDPAQGAYDPDTEVTLTAQAEMGWMFSGWSGDVTGTDNPHTVIMDSDKSVTATFTEQFILDVAIVGSGTVTFDPDGGVYDEGAVVTLTATPEEGWAFSQWGGDAAGSQNTAVVVMDGDKSVTATFNEVLDGQFVLTITAQGSGIVTAEPAQGAYDPGTEVILEALPDAGWEFSEWSGDLTGSDTPKMVTMDSDKAVTATFTEAEAEFALVVNPVGSGTVSIDPQMAMYPEGTVVTLTATPDMGWAFSEWSGDASGSQNTAVIVMDSDKIVTATFTEIQPGQFVLSITTDGSGVVTVDPAQGAYDPDTQVTLTARAETGWRFSNWTGDLTGSENPATISMDADKGITAIFTELKKVKRSNSDCFIGTASSGRLAGGCMVGLLLIGVSVLIFALATVLQKERRTTKQVEK